VKVEEHSQQQPIISASLIDTGGDGASAGVTANDSTKGFAFRQLPPLIETASVLGTATNMKDTPSDLTIPSDSSINPEQRQQQQQQPPNSPSQLLRVDVNNNSPLLNLFHLQRREKYRLECISVVETILASQYSLLSCFASDGTKNENSMNNPRHAEKTLSDEESVSVLIGIHTGLVLLKDELFVAAREKFSQARAAAPVFPSSLSPALQQKRATDLKKPVREIELDTKFHPVLDRCGVTPEYLEFLISVCDQALRGDAKEARLIFKIHRVY
jgi:hypothetical protein